MSGVVVSTPALAVALLEAQVRVYAPHSRLELLNHPKSKEYFMEIFLGLAIVSFVLVVAADTLQQRRRNIDKNN